MKRESATLLTGRAVGKSKTVTGQLERRLQ
jgi:hypothetical protein